MARLVSVRLEDILDAIERAQSALQDSSIDDLEKDVRTRWFIERAIEIVSEASRHLGDEVRMRQSAIPWKKVAGIGNILRHGYDQVAADVLWNVVRDDFPVLLKACEEELPRVRASEASQED